MTTRKMKFFELWRKKKERGELLERANQLRLHPAQLRGLLGDSGVRAALQNSRMASLLPPVGTEVFRRLTPASLGKIQQRHDAEDEKRQTRKDNKEVAKDLHKPASDLEAGKPLPFIYSAPAPEHLNTPLEELDPFYQSQKTFIVLSKGNIIHRFNAEPACYLLSPFNPLRTIAIKILTHSLFRLLIMMTILTNCVFMTMSDPPAWSRTVEIMFTAIYTFEAIIKVVSRGVFIGKFTFLRDPWNWLDIVVVSTAYLAEFVDLDVVRTVPRVLKIIPVIPGLKTTVSALLQSTKRLADVIVVMAFGLGILALIGLQMFMGSLKNKCVMWPDFNSTLEFNYSEYIYTKENYYFLPGQLDALVCGNSSDAGVCPEGFVCLRTGSNPNYGFTSYDSFGWSLLSLFRIMTQDFWENLMQMTFRTAGKTSLIFFVGFFFPGCFCLLSLFVAAAAVASSEREEASAVEAKEKEEEFTQIVEVLKRREEKEQAACRAALSEDPEGENKSQKHTAIEGFGEDRRSCPPCWFVFADFLLKWNCCGCWRWLKQRLYTFITNPFFTLGIVICLILNTLHMAMDHYPMTEWFEVKWSEAHLVFTAIFTAEMVFKLVAMDPYGYFQVGWNIFDSIIVTISLLDLSMCCFPHWFVLMRMLRLARWWPSFHMLLKIIWRSLRALRNLTLVLLIMVFIFSMAGMQLFGKDYRSCTCRISVDCELPRWHMTDFFHAFLIVIRVLCGEWIETMWDCMEVSGQTVCLIFFMVVVVIGYLLVLNLFLALLLSSSNSDSLAAPEDKEKNNLHIAISQIKSAVETLLGKKTQTNPDHTEVDSKEDNKKEYLTLTLVTSDQQVSEVKALSGDHGNPTSDHHDNRSQRDASKMPENEDKKEKNKHPEVQQHKDDDHEGNTPEDCCSDKCYGCCPFLDIDTSQGTGRVWSNFRRACFSIVQHKCFNNFIIVIILLSSAALVFEDIYLHSRQVLQMVIERADQVFTFLFLMEMLLKWIAIGLKKYFTDAWCWIDFLILHVSLVSLAANWFGYSELGVVQFLRTLRALGPLRILSRFQRLRVVVQVLVRSVPLLFDVLLVSCVVWLIFSVLGVNLFAGKFFYCFNETSEEFFLAESVNNKSDCLSLETDNYSEVRWKNGRLNYDNVLNGYLSLLHLVASTDSNDILYSAVDATMVESQPIYESNIFMNLYFICFIIISSFFTFNFFIRTIIGTYSGKHIFMTEGQQKYWRAVKKPKKTVPRPENRCQAQLFDLVTKPCFEVFMVVVIVLNMVALMIETDGQSFQMDVILFWFHFSFILIFLLEFILKIIALRRHYFSDGWNIVDFVVLIVSIAGMFVADLLEMYFVSPSCFAVVRSARVVRLFSLLRCARGIQKLLLAFMRSLPALFNIGLLLFIITCTFSIFGMFNFAHLKREAMIDDMYNFETFRNSLICLLMISTSSGWGGLLYPMLSTPPDCDPDTENPGSTVRGNCGSPAVAIAFFTAHIGLTFLLVVHMYIIVILETFDSEDAESLSDDDLQMFHKTWRKFDPEDSQVIQYSELSDFCDALQDPLRIPKPNTIKLIHMDLSLLSGDKIHCEDVFLALAAQVLVDSEKMDALKARLKEKFMTITSKESLEPISSTLQRKQEDVAAAVIQRAYRKHVLQHRDDAEETAVESVDGGVSGGALQ